MTKAFDDVASSHLVLRPPRRVRVSQGAAESLIVAQPGQARMAWSATETPYMVEPIDMLASRTHEAVIFVGPARTGKALDLATPIATPSGWTTMGLLSVGDRVFDDAGVPTRVTFVTEVQFDRPCYEVVFATGDVLVADADHQWGVERFYWREPHWRTEVLTTADLLRDLHYGRGRFRYRVRNTKPINLPERDLPIDPYVLGVWLGNGSATQAVISADCDDVDHYVAEFEAVGHSCHRRPDKGRAVAIGVDLGSPPNSLSKRLRALGVFGSKHIPQIYQRSSVSQRRALLSGLMDTDGTCSKAIANAEFSTTSFDLAQGVMELASSLGYKPSLATKATTWVYLGEVRRGRSFRITFPTTVNPFRMPRKRDVCRQSQVDVSEYRQIVEIRPVESRPVRCIQVESASHMYLAGRSMIPTHNTLAFTDAWMSHVVVHDPGDMLIVQMSQDKAREFSKTRVDRALVNSPKLAALKSISAHHDNTHDKIFKHGMWLRIGWPTATNLSGSDYRYVSIPDYDRTPDDVEGEGSKFALALKRTQTFRSRGMCAAESSPGRPVVDPKWIARTAHEAPPTGSPGEGSGILGLYNGTDRRRWYWKCPDCRDWFEAAPGLKLFCLPDELELIELVRETNLDVWARERAFVWCPHCGSQIDPRHKNHLNQNGRWVRDGQLLNSDDELMGVPVSSLNAGFWLGGVAATYQSWDRLIARYLMGLRDYVLNGSEQSLQTTTNVDQGMPYLSRHLQQLGGSKLTPADRTEDVPRFVVPDWTRLVVASVDVQGGQNARFEVQVHAVGPYFEQQLIDRYPIKESEREGMGGKAPIDPAAYPEDWDLLTKKVVQATYRTSIEGREIRVMQTVVDTGGEGGRRQMDDEIEGGVTTNAYEWYRRLRAQGIERRVMLIKGANTKVDYYVKETMQGRRSSKDMDDVLVYYINPNLLKDDVYSALKRSEVGPNYYHFPKWLPKSFFDELFAEVRGPDGTYTQIRRRNESLDLCVMIRAGLLRLGVDKIVDWANPPPWAAPLDRNDQVMTSEQRRAVQQKSDRPLPRPSRVKSSYIG